MDTSKFRYQARAIGWAVLQAEKELRVAQNSGDVEWIKQVEYMIEQLELAQTSILYIEDLERVIKMVTQ